MARKNKTLNAKRRLIALEKAKAPAIRNPAALALGLHFRNHRGSDARKAASRKACRGKVSY
jgi:hypothetical protein